ncbi:MAG: hypothetical protein NT154_03625, partial [Verrucomicrobia bacterium]|nr:hypothetical protein [Verrucomicrobiota bacterium]
MNANPVQRSRQDLFRATVVCAWMLLVSFALPGIALGQTYTLIWQEGFDSSLANWTQGSTPFTYSLIQNKGGYTGAGAAYCISNSAAQIYRYVNGAGRPFAQGHVTGYFYDAAGGWKAGTCGRNYRQVISLRNGNSMILDNGFNSTGSSGDSTQYYYRCYGGSGSFTAYATRWAATPCAGAWIYFDLLVTPGVPGASPVGTMTAMVTDGGGTFSITQSLPSNYFSYGIERVTLGQSSSNSSERDCYWDDIKFEAYAPGTPTGFNGTANSTSQITWSWVRADDNLFGFDLMDSNGNHKSPDHPTTGWLTRSATSWAETGLAANTQYTRKVQAWDGSLNSPASGTVSKYTLSIAPSSGSVTSDNATPGVGNPVTWTPVGGFGAGKVQYYRYAWDQTLTHSWTDTETQWSNGMLQTTPAATGVWYLHVKGYNGDNVGNGTFNYSVTASSCLSAPTAGNNGPICAGSQLNLTASTVSGAIHAWTGPNGFTSSEQNPIIPNATIAASGQYSVTLTANGCTSPPGTTTATVYAAPVAPSPNAHYNVAPSLSLKIDIADLLKQWSGSSLSLESVGSGSSAGGTVSNNSTYIFYLPPIGPVASDT